MLFAFIDVTDGRAFVFQMSLDELRESIMKIISFLTPLTRYVAPLCPFLDELKLNLGKS
jgi:hypothetical protein